MEAPLKDCTTLEQRAVIRFLNAEGIQTSQICQRIKNIYDLEHPAYSPDLAPSGYFPFGLLKKELKGKPFGSDEDVQKVVQDFFHTLPKSAYKEGIYKLPERWRRCIESQGIISLEIQLFLARAVSAISSFEKRANIKFCVKLKKSSTETLALINEAYEDDKLSGTEVYLWYKRFKDGCKNITDDSRSGRPLTSTTDRNIGQRLPEKSRNGHLRSILRKYAEHVNK
ncbi:hypothetical protein LAZ67_22002151 [Cordylochernes scorpioides]|uniref:Mos1 transposase HTH domain-containing protein n=1 Tax=Cordylochernes scorpioides TaxID=51811 RepID=A0ABY6LU80_9ARAC|nr:hypothetical protein LAZ67_22002151 [Cordylochernes scorpioides]